jgi:uncharacterized glyoxalase superfamily protein PhnB
MAGQFRFIFVTKKFDATLAFYRDDLGLPLLESWDHGLQERGAELQAGSGTIMFTALSPLSGYTLGLSADQNGVSIGLEVQDVETWYQQAVKKKLAISQKLGQYPWGERGFTLTDPNGIGVYIFSRQGNLGNSEN